MDASLFLKMLGDKNVINLKKLKYKYPQADMDEFVSLLRDNAFTPLPLLDFKGDTVVYMPGLARVYMNALKPPAAPERYDAGMADKETEIAATLTIESIDFSRDSVRRILQGYAPTDRSEERIYGLKKGLEYISKGHEITETNY